MGRLNRLKKLFYNQNIEMRQHALLTILFKIAILGFAVFALLQFFIIHQHTLGILNTVAFFIFLLSFIDYKIYKNYMRTATLTTSTIMIFFILITYTTKNEDAILFWTLLAPLFAYAINGKSLGSLYTSIYYLSIYIITWQGIGVWNGGHFSQNAYFYYVSVTFLVALIIYFYVQLYENYSKEHHEQNIQLKEAQTIANIGSWEWNIKNNSLKWSNEIFFILGLDPKKVKPSYALFVEMTHPDDRENVDRAVQESIKNNTKYNIVHRLVLPNKTEKIVREHARTYYDNEGNPLRMSGTVQDITKEIRIKQTLREQKEALETIFKKTSDGVLLIQEGRFIDCNDAAIKMLKASNKEQILNALPGDISPAKQPGGKGSPEKAAEMIGKALQEGSANFECFHKAFDNSTFIVDVTLTRLEINNDTVIHVSWRDITEKKALEEQVQNYQKDLVFEVEEKTKQLLIQKERAETASKAKSEFLTNMNHELRTPLNAILGFIHLLAKDEQDPKKRQYFKLVEEGSESLLGVINDVMDFSKIESGKFNLDLRDVEIAQSAQNFIAFLGGAAQKKDIDYHFEVDQNIPQMHTDPLRLQQIIANLIGNAIKFTPKNGRIEIKLLYKKGDNALCFSVKDNGIGISKKQQEKIFEPFLQADMSTTRLYGGTGLGLAISTHLLKMLGGEMQLTSQENQGSEFRFTIPIQKVLGKALSTLDAKVSLIQHEEDPKIDLPILVAEDNTFNLYLYEEFFKELNISNITFVTNGEEALNAYENQDFKFILLDIHMPIVDGVEVFKRIREFEKETQRDKSTIIAITADSEESNKKKLLTLGFDDFLAKPLNLDNFKQILHNYL
ncbi:MAG: ATP-binding protein [Thiovulaceae bacterium]|nr:ATP-binding protein [Sulfurimonadaceae bacterium]